MEGFFQFTLVMATFLVSLVSGFLFAFAVVVMPGIRTLGDGEFIRAFQRMDGVIQNNHPLFILVWVGSIAAILISVILGISRLEETRLLIMIVAALSYLLGVQLPTVAINIPLNNRLQRLDVGTMNDGARRQARQDFEPRWNRWNSLRTFMSCLASALLIFLMFVI